MVWVMESSIRLMSKSESVNGKTSYSAVRKKADVLVGNDTVPISM